jgi:pilus assembly protein CpaE
MFQDRANGGARPLSVELFGPESDCSHIKAMLAEVRELSLVVTDGIAADSDGRANPDADAIMVVVEGDGPAVLRKLRSGRGDNQRQLIFALLRERSASLMREALRAGADELLFLPLDSGQLTRSLLNLSEATHKADLADGGLICSFTSNSGGVGVTSLVGNLGLALRYKFDLRVALVDLHLQAAALSVFLDLKAGPTIMALSHGPRDVDSMKLESALSRHANGMYLLAAPNKIEESELVTEEIITDALRLMRQLFDFVLVDCGNYVDSRMASVWEKSDRLFYLIDQTVTGARGAGRFLEVFNRLGIAGSTPQLIVTKYRNDHPIGTEQLAEALELPVYATVPSDAETLERVHLAGTDLWVENSKAPIAIAIEQLAAKISGRDHGSQPVRRASFVSRLLSGTSTVKRDENRKRAFRPPPAEESLTGK